MKKKVVSKAKIIVEPSPIEKIMIDQKRRKMFDSFAIADLALEVIKISIIDGIKGTTFNKIKMFEKLDKIDSLLSDVRKSEISKIVGMHPDYIEVMENEHAVEIHRWLSLMAFYPTQYLAKYNDDIEAKKLYDNVPSAANPIEDYLLKSGFSMFFTSDPKSEGASKKYCKGPIVFHQPNESEEIFLFEMTGGISILNLNDLQDVKRLAELSNIEGVLKP